jgi:hypothetical protein
MCIYCGTQYHRLIYENHIGPIPVDDEGRSYEIHHIDGDHNNNSLDNLQCVSIKEHYNIHFKQGDLKACLIMSQRMKLSPAEKSRLAKISNAGAKNPSFGTIWITDGINNKKICKESKIPEGWSKGRSFNTDFADKFTKRSKVGKNNPRYNHTMYNFRNTTTSEEVTLTPGEFAVVYGINIKKVRGLFRKNLVSVKDWIIIF